MMSERENYKLTDSKVKAIAKQLAPDKRVRYSDGDSLYLVHDPKGSLYWVMSYRYQSDKDLKPKQKTYHIGTYKLSSQIVDTKFKPEVSLKQARLERNIAKKLINDGVDPTEHKNSMKNQYEQKDLFKAIAKSYITRKSQTTEKNVQKLQGFLNNHILGHIGEYPIGAIKPQDIIRTGLAIQDKFEERGKHTSETAPECMGLITSIFEFAINTLGYDIVNIAKGRNKALRPHKANRMKSVEQHQFPELLRNIDNYIANHPNAHEQTVAGLQLMALCFVRTKELRHFEWSEIDYHKNVWRIPAHKMKMRQDHIIPLSPQAMSIVERMRPLTGKKDYVFYNFESNKPYSEAWFNQALKRMGYSGNPYPAMTGHGFRSLASTGIKELGFRDDAIEIQLAHLDQSSVKRRYDLSKYLAYRQMMMNEWANYLDDLRAGKAINFDLLTPDELEELKQKREYKTSNMTLYDEDTILQSLQAQGISKEELMKLAERL